MRPLYEMSTIQIEITSSCVLKCSNCTRFCGTHKVPFYISTDDFKKAIDSLVGYSKQPHAIVGFMGGEPMLHSQFEEFCAYALSKIERSKLGLWSTFPAKFSKYRETIVKTFGQLLLNDHSREDILHAPVLMAAEDAFQEKCPSCHGEYSMGVPEDGMGRGRGPCGTCGGKGTVTNEADLMAATERCWIQESWSAAINPKGAFFCEVAASLSDLFDGPRGWDVEPGWWKKTTKDFTAQRDWACRRCGAALPIQRIRNSQDERDDVSVSSLERLKAVGSRKVAKGDFVVHEQFNYDRTLAEHGTYPDQTYKDWEYRQGIAQRYGIWLSLNDRGYMEPHLMTDGWRPKPNLYQIMQAEAKEAVNA